MILQELNEVESGIRELKENDFLGPIERQERKARKLSRHGHSLTHNDLLFEDHSGFFFKMEANLLEKRRNMEKELYLQEERRLKRLRKS